MQVFALPCQLPGLALPLALSLVMPFATPMGGGAPLPDDGAPRRWDGSTREVHEWGTFTGVQGSDGVELDGLLHDPFGLPPFVYDIVAEKGLTGLSPKMETPVIYFYSPEEWRPRVRVDFPNGLVTQWYPAPSRANLRGKQGFGPADAERIESAFTNRVLEKGYIDWGRYGELVIHAPGAPSESVELPQVEAGDPWLFSRRVEANALTIENYSHGDELAPGPRKESERFLFYRGLGDFELPVVAEVGQARLADGKYSVTLGLRNQREEEPLRHLFLVYVNGKESGFTKLPDLAGERRFENLELSMRPFAKSSAELVGAVAGALEQTGLFTDEAFAMARTWEKNWFQDPGLRLLYVLPEELVERELPLVINPRPSGLFDQADDENNPSPDVVRRTFVARLDLLSPQQEEEILDTLEDIGEVIGHDPGVDPEIAAAAVETVRSWGRYVLPYLERARALGAEEAAIERALALTAE